MVQKLLLQKKPLKALRNKLPAYRKKASDPWNMKRFGGI
jgi:hypothetical protein